LAAVGLIVWAAWPRAFLPPGPKKTKKANRTTPRNWRDGPVSLKIKVGAPEKSGSSA